MFEIAAISIAVVAFWLVGFFGSPAEGETYEKFSIGNRSLGVFAIAAGLSMSFVGGASTLNMASLGYLHGFQGLVDPIAAFVGLMIAAAIAHWYRRDSFFTIVESLSGSSRPLLAVTTFVSVAFYALMTAVQILAFTKLVSPFFPVQPYILSIAVTFLVGSYTLRSGMNAVTRTDIVQLIVVLVFFVAPVIYIGVIAELNSNNQVGREFTQIPVNTALILGFPLLLVPIMQDVKLRAQAAKDLETARTGVLFAGICYLGIVSASVFVGRAMAQSGIDLADSEQALTYAMTHYFGAAGVLIVIALMAAILSTFDSMAFSAVTTSRGALQSLNLPIPRLVIGAVIFGAALLIATLFQTVLGITLFALLMYVSVLLPIAGGRYLGVSDAKLTGSVIVFLAIAISVHMLKAAPVPEAVFYPVLHLVIIVIARILPSGD